MVRKIIVSITPAEAAEIIAGIRQPITDLFKLDPKDGRPLVTISWTKEMDIFYICVEGEPIKEQK
jgi:hypothetical protein